MQVSSKGLALIKEFEGCKLTAYLCPAKVWTIGYGQTGPDIVKGKTITKAQADQLLKDAVDKEYGPAVLKAIGPAAATVLQEEFDAMVSLCYNIGIKAFTNSTVAARYKAGRKTEAANAFSMWKKAGGKILPGLVRRRAAETALFLSAKGNVAKVERITSDGVLSVPEGSIVPENKANDKPLTRSKEVIVGSTLGIGGAAQAVSLLSVGDATDLKTSIQQASVEMKGTFLDQYHFQEISSLITFLIGLYIIYIRFIQRDAGDR